MKETSVIKTIFFDDEEIGNYVSKKINKTWNNPLHCHGADQGRVKIVKDNSKKVLQIIHNKNKIGPLEGGAQWKLNLNNSYDELYLQFKVKFSEDFDFVRGGKLPGLVGGSNPAGGKEVTGLDGFSVRMMWRENGKAEQYVYHMNKTKEYGEDFYWKKSNNENIYFKKGIWHKIKTRIKMNQTDKNNGIIQTWLDEKLVLDLRIQLRDIKANFGIDGFNFVTFFGGNDKTWAPKKDESIFFNEFIISTKNIN